MVNQEFLELPYTGLPRNLPGPFSKPLTHLKKTVDEIIYQVLDKFPFTGFYWCIKVQTGIVEWITDHFLHEKIDADSSPLTNGRKQ